MSRCALLLRKIVRQLADYVMQFRAKLPVELQFLRRQRLKTLQFHLQENVFDFEEIAKQILEQSCSPDGLLRCASRLLHSTAHASAEKTQGATSTARGEQNTNMLGFQCYGRRQQASARHSLLEFWLLVI